MEEPFNPYDIPEIQISYTSNVLPYNRPKIHSSWDAYRIALSHWDMNRIDLVEQFKIVLMNPVGGVLGIAEIGTGGLNEVTADRRLIFGIALKAAASNILLVHNHPSGDLNPSTEDKVVTDSVSRAGRLLNIRVRDHLIISRHGYYSFLKQGVMP